MSHSSIKNWTLTDSSSRIVMERLGRETKCPRLNLGLPIIKQKVAFQTTLILLKMILRTLFAYSSRVTPILIFWKRMLSL